MRPLAIFIVLLFESSLAAQQLKEITNTIGMKLVLIHRGSFTMGSTDSEIGRNGDEAPHEVTLTKSYYLGVYEVTQEQYEKVMGTRPSAFIGIQLPVNQISPGDASTFCKKLAELPEEKSAGRIYRLPTEAEWEYACRAASPSAFCFGDSEETLDEFAWFDRKDGRSPHPVGQKKPNRWGLYDMHGNVWEWCQDWYAEYTTVETTDPSGPREGKSIVFRGGSWSNPAFCCRSAYRDQIDPTFTSGSIGFRVAMSLPTKQPTPPSPK